MNPELQNLLILWGKLSKADKYTFQKNVQIFDGHNIILGTSTGTEFGTTALQKLAFFGSPPVAQFTTHFNASAGATYTNTEQNIINNLQAALKTYGLIIP